MEQGTIFDVEAEPASKNHACSGSSCQVCNAHGTPGHLNLGLPCRYCQLEAADEAKRLGQADELRTVDEYYRYKFDQLLETLAATRAPFTSEAIVERIGLPSIGQNANNAVGALMSAAAKRGLIVKVGYTKSKRRESHGRVIATWEGV